MPIHTIMRSRGRVNMSQKIEERCPYCDTQFAVEFENEDDELVYCPSCGEELPSFEDELDLNDEDEWD